MQSPSESATSKLPGVIAALFDLSRLTLLAQICESRLVVKRALAERAASFAEFACWVVDLQKRCLHQHSRTVAWPIETTFQRKLADATLGDFTSLKALLKSSEDRLRGAVQSLQRSSGMGSELAALISGVVFSVLREDGEISAEPLPFASSNGGVARTLYGPRKTSFDPAFVPTYSVLDEPSPQFGDTLIETVPYFWTLALREANAADICALSAIEYDGLPPEFYRDFAKQSWDETRHSVMFFNLAVDLIPDLKKDVGTKYRFAQEIDQFLQFGKGLPVPREGGLYEAIWNSDLDERLVLMQIRTEGPAVEKCKRRQIQSLSNSYPAIRAAYQIDEIDETAHAAIGWRWLRHLCPTEESRREAIERTDLLRGFLLATSISAHGTETISGICHKVVTM